MANITKRNNTYSIRVSCGYDSKGKQIIQSMTWKPEIGMSPKQIEKELNRQAVMFEEKCNGGYQSKAVKFEVFAEEWFEFYASRTFVILHTKECSSFVGELMPLSVI